jgi:PAS domain S-box-containing protein
MVHPRILVIASNLQAAHALSGVLTNDGATDLEHKTVSAADAVAFLRESITSNTAPGLIVIGPDVPKPVALAVEMRPLCALCHFLFVRDANETAKLRHELTWATLIGAHWSLAKTDDPALPRLVRTALTDVQRRSRLRTTLDRVNVQLDAHRSVDSIEYRRQVISEHFLTSFLAQTRDAIVSLDTRHHVLYWNAGAERLFGLKFAQVNGYPVSRLPFWSEAMNGTLERIVGKEGALTEEVDCTVAGKEMMLEIGYSAVRDTSGKTVGITLVIRDVSERHRKLEAERAAHHERAAMLDSERQQLRNFFDQAPGFVVVMRGPRHVIELANRAFYQIIGYRDVIGKAIQDAIPELQGQAFFELLDEAYASSQPYVDRGMRVGIQRTPDSPMEPVFVDFVIQPIFGQDGEVDGLFCQGHDVTQQKLLQDALLEHQTQLEKMVADRTAQLRQVEEELHQAQKLDAIGKLTGGVAHDFNNVLQVIGGNLDILQATFAEDVQAVERLKPAIAAVQRGARLSAQLLAFARRQPLRPVATNMGRILKDMDALLRRALGEFIEIETIAGGGLWTVMVDRNQLENAILNLAINARDAMKEGGRLTLELCNAMLDDHYAQAHAEVQPGQYVMLAVSDTGTGMPPEVIDRAFEPFFTTKREGEGTGLGLSMVYGFVKQSGGHVKIYSEPGHGTSIKIYLPRTHQPEASVPDLKAGPVVGGSETILVVEDDPEVQNTTVETLSSLGYKVLKANDGQSALSILQSGLAIDLLFTDVVMPGLLRSPDLARHAKLLLPDIAVLFTSGYTQNAIVHGGRLDPGVELLSKPYRRKDLARKIRHMLRNRQHSAETFADGASDVSDSAPQPVASSTVAQASAAEAEPQTAGSLRILVVEDNTDSRQMLCELLSLLGHDVESARSAEQAQGQIEKTAFDVLLTDISLPGLSGVDLAREAKAQHPSLVVIFASGYSNAPGVDFPFYSLLKPYDLSSLQDVLAQAATALGRSG